MADIQVHFVVSGITPEHQKVLARVIHPTTDHKKLVPASASEIHDFIIKYGINGLNLMIADSRKQSGEPRLAPMTMTLGV